MYSHTMASIHIQHCCYSGSKSLSRRRKSEAPTEKFCLLSLLLSFIPNCGTRHSRFVPVQLALLLWDLFRWINPDSCDSVLVFWSWIVHIPKMNGWQVCLLYLFLSSLSKTMRFLPKAREITWWSKSDFWLRVWFAILFCAWQTCSYVMKELFDNKKRTHQLYLFYIKSLSTLCNLMDCSH